MTREEERQLLRRDNNHYLWRKPRAQWTADDLKMLTGETHLEPKTPKVIAEPEPRQFAQKQPVIVTSAQGTKEYESVVLCAAELGMSSAVIYSKLNGHQKNEGDFVFMKSKMNYQNGQ